MGGGGAGGRKKRHRGRCVNEMYKKEMEREHRGSEKQCKIYVYTQMTGKGYDKYMEHTKFDTKGILILITKRRAKGGKPTCLHTTGPRRAKLLPAFPVPFRHDKPPKALPRNPDADRGVLEPK